MGRCSSAPASPDQAGQIWSPNLDFGPLATFLARRRSCRGRLARVLALCLRSLFRQLRRQPVDVDRPKHLAIVAKAAKVVGVLQRLEPFSALLTLLLQAPLHVVPLAEFVCSHAHPHKIQVPQEEAEEYCAHYASQDNDEDEHALSGKHVLANDHVRRGVLLARHRIDEHCPEKVLLDHDMVGDRCPEAATVKAYRQMPEKKCE